MKSTNADRERDYIEFKAKMERLNERAIGRLLVRIDDLLADPDNLIKAD